VRNTVETSMDALRFLRRLNRGDRNAAERIAKAIDGLAGDPRPHRVKPLVGRPGRHPGERLPGDLSVDDDRLVVVVLDIGHRREVYDR
jgi:mRNA interferase RelE/StbE